MTRIDRTSPVLVAATLAASCGVLVGEIGDTMAIALLLLGLAGLAVCARVGPRHSDGTTAPPDRHLSPAPPWWLNPAWMIPLAGLPSLLLAYRISPSVFRSDWNTPKYFDETHLVLGVVMLAGFTAGALVAGLWLGRERTPARRSEALSPEQVLRLRSAIYVLFVLTLLGYAAQLIFAAARGLDATEVTAVFTGASPVGDVKREYLRPVTGVTTLTQFGLVVIVGLALLRRLDPGVPYGRLIATLVVLGAVRSVLYAERLALLELVVPLAVISLALPRTDRLRRTSLRRAALAIAPVWIPVVLLLAFGAFEYVRSWSSYYAEANPNRSYAGFVLDRIGAYYATASNNSALLIEHDPRLSQVPYHTAEWLWNLPLADRVVSYERVAGVDFSDAYESLLLRLATPEFTNPGGILVPVFDLGPLAGLVVWIALGILFAIAYRKFLLLQPSGLLIFPLLFLGCLEVGRLFYWSLGRAFPALAGAIVIGLWLDRGARAADSAPVSPTARDAALQMPPR